MWRYVQSVQGIRYIHKCVYKGDDRTTMEVETDEIKRLVESRYISPMQASYRMLEYHTNSDSPPKSEQSILFPASADEGQLRHAADMSWTTLMAYLEYSRLNEDGRTVLYQEFFRILRLSKNQESLIVGLDGLKDPRLAVWST
ncbi:hypothetical protein OnM2_082006 [Erysiphe neolycopersici]|uniref:Uncharacterized protein n=1 Tax=Erysiphe neolycopersici TaxID=212602 RepID=A0A420HFU4_9PEZI|nr:hypothetical protein OnM2_082006 [Erysiphe neolycopersici]